VPFQIEADFIHKIGTVVEETDESLLWLELLEDAGIVQVSWLHRLNQRETNWFGYFKHR
jgi:hypothetical protein